MVRTNEPALGGLRRRFASWRQKRLKRSRIPEDLWKAAIKAARKHGVWRTAQRLGVDYYSLKARLKRKPARARDNGAVEFVELPGKLSSAGPVSVVELQDGDGHRLRVELRDEVNAQSLAMSLWKQRR